MRIVFFAILMFLFFMCSTSEAILLKMFQLPVPLTGPESLAFDRNGTGPYVGVSDGRILKYQGDSFTEYAYTSPNRNKTICDGLADFSMLQATCGRPLGIAFNNKTGELYAADAYFGLVKVGVNGGTPTQLVGSIQGNPIRFASGLDVYSETGIVYFTEASTNYQISNLQAMMMSNDSSGRLFQYDPSTNQTRVLLSGLAVPGGVAVSKNGSFVLVSEFKANRIQRFWITGPRANTSEIFYRLIGAPDNIKRNSKGEFWVAVNNLLGLPPPPMPAIMAAGYRFNENGMLLQIISLAAEYGIDSVSEVHEFNGALYSGSLQVPYATKFTP